MKIGLVVSRFKFGGVEMYVLRLSDRLRQRGHEVVVIATEECGEWWSRVPDTGAEAVAVLPSAYRTVSRWVREVGRRIRDLELDVLILNHAWSAQATIGMLEDRVVAVPVLHNEDTPVLEVACANREAWNFVIAPSLRLYKQALARGIDEERVRLIPYGIEVPSEMSPAAGSAGPLRLLYVGRIEERQKGVFLLPEIMSRLKDACPGACLTVIGEGPDDEALRRAVTERGLSDVVTFLPRLPNEAVMGHLRQAAALLMPSNFEGFGILILEAMANGCLAIVSRLPDITDWILDDGRCGYLAEKGDATSFCRAVEDMVRRPDEAEAKRRAAHEKCRQTFFIDVMVDAHLREIEAARRHPVRRDGVPDVAREMLCWKDYMPNALRRVYTRVRRTIAGRHR